MGLLVRVGVRLFGPTITFYVRMHWPLKRRLDDGARKGEREDERYEMRDRVTGCGDDEPGPEYSVKAPCYGKEAGYNTRHHQPAWVQPQPRLGYAKGKHIRTRYEESYRDEKKTRRRAWHLAVVLTVAALKDLQLSRWQAVGFWFLNRVAS
jgi:hypothetical protein